MELCKEWLGVMAFLFIAFCLTICLLMCGISTCKSCLKNGLKSKETAFICCSPIYFVIDMLRAVAVYVKLIRPGKKPTCPNCEIQDVESGGGCGRGVQVQVMNSFAPGFELQSFGEVQQLQYYKMP